MKKVLALILAMVICLTVCACAGGNGNSKYVGTYSGYYGRMHDDITKANGFSATSSGTRTLILNADGTGTESYVGHFDWEDEDDDVTMYSYKITWEVIDGYVYVTGSGDFLVGSAKHVSDDRYRLEGKTLVDADNPTSMSGKLTKVN